jgi:predicted O-methyltransferase YrrM
MGPEEISRALAGIPHMAPDQGREIFDFVREHGLRNCLELGFAHGVGTAYLAAAVSAFEGGTVATVDLESARERRPDIYTTLTRAGVNAGIVQIFFEPTSYTWRMMKFLQAGRGESFDFIFIDGAHSWFVDGFAFFLAERLLRPGGWILFDDLNWRFSYPEMVRSCDWVQNMPAEEKDTPQVRMIWDLLVKAHPSFDFLVEKGNWAYARKALGISHTKIVYQYHPLLTAVIDLKNYIRWHLAR